MALENEEGVLSSGATKTGEQEQSCLRASGSDLGYIQDLNLYQFPPPIHVLSLLDIFTADFFPALQPITIVAQPS